MDNVEAIKRIENHIRVHRIGQYPHIKIAEALRLAISALREPIRKWIPVTERLPETETDRFQDEDGSDYAYETSEWLWGIDVRGVQVRVCYESGFLFRGWVDERGKEYEITHWTHLLDPPEEHSEATR